MTNISTWAQQKPVLKFKNYSTKDGLSNNLVWDVSQDSIGLVVIATEDGLNVFDGYEFVVQKEREDTNSLSGNRILQVVNDDEGDEWIIAWGGGISLYQYTKGKYKRLMAPDRLPSNYISKILPEKSGRMWIAAIGYGLILYSKKEDKTIQTYFPSENNSLDANLERITSMVYDRHGNIWIGTIGGLYYFNVLTNSVEHVFLSETNPVVRYLFYDSNGQLWVSTDEQGLIVIGEEKKIRQYTYSPEKEFGIASNTISEIAEAADHTIYIGTSKGLCIYDPNIDGFYNYRHNKFDRYSIGGDIIRNVSIDDKGRVWIGTNYGGVSIYDPHFSDIKHFYKQAIENTLTHDNVTAVLQYSDKELWVGTDGGGICTFNLETYNFQKLNFHYEDPSDTENVKIKDLFKDTKGRIWIGYWSGGLEIFNPKTCNLKRFVEADGSSKGPGSNNIMNFAEDSNGNYWLATYGDGVNFFNASDMTFKSCPRTDHNTGELAIFENVTSVAYHNDKIYACSENGLLATIDPETLEVSKIDEVNIPYLITCVRSDNDGKLLIGTFGAGILVLDGDKLETTYEFQGGNVFSFELDKDNFIWAATNDGLCKYDRTLRTYEQFGVERGLMEKNFNYNASITLTDGTMVFGGGEGFNMFKPEQIHFIKDESPLVLANLEISNKSISVNNSNILEKPFRLTTAITLTHKEPIFSISYASLNYTYNKNINYAYRLKGFIDEEWQYVGEQRRATYSNLDPGEYIFEVTAYTSADHLSDPIALKITILPPWWKTSWFIFVEILIVVMLVILFWRWRTNNLIVDRKKLQQLVEEQNKSIAEQNNMLKEKNDQLEKMNRSIVNQEKEIREINRTLESKIEQRTKDLSRTLNDLNITMAELDRFVYSASHDLIAPIKSIRGVINLSRHVNTMDDCEKNLMHIERSTDQLENVIKSLKDYSYNLNHEIDKQVVPLFDLVCECIEEFHEYIQNLGIDVHINMPVKFSVESDPIRLKAIFTNLIGNAVLYQDLHKNDRRITIGIIKRDNYLITTIHDNGIGINSKLKGRVFDMFYRGSELSKGAGLGLYIVNETVKKLQGNIQLDSDEGVGTNVVISIPVA